MLGFEYIYNNSLYIFEKTPLLGNGSFIDYVIICIIALILLSCTYYVIPYFHLLGKYLAEEKEREKRKIFIRRIALQKDVEAEIEKEMHL